MSIIISIIVLSVFGVLFAAMAVAPLAMDEARRHPALGASAVHAPISITSGRNENATATAIGRTAA